PDLFRSASRGNLFLTSRQKAERTEAGSPFYVTRQLADYHLTRPSCICFPLMVGGAKKGSLPFQPGDAESPATANLTDAARAYLQSLDVGDLDKDPDSGGILWMHCLAIGHSIAYLRENAGGLWQDWPRVPLPPDGAALRASAALGRQVAALLDTEAAVPG